MSSQSNRKKSRVARILLVPAMLAFGFPALADVAMKLAPELSSTTALPVTGRSSGNSLAVGPWHVVMPAPYTTDGWQFSGTPRFVPANADLSVKAERAWLEFEVSSDVPGSHPASAGCLAQGRFASLTRFHARSEDETTITIPGFPRLDCEFSGPRAGTLTLRAAFATQIDHGDARFGADQWIVRSVNTHAKQKSKFPWTRFGYEIELDGHVVAAVETYGAGRVWLSSALSRDQQDQLSTIVAALLYYGSLLEQQDA